MNDTINDLISQLESLLHPILSRCHRVLILFSAQAEGSLGWLLVKAVERCDCVPVTPNGDYRWKNLLRLAFSERTETVIGTAELILGIHKVAKATHTPLFVHDVLLCDNSTVWQREGIQRGLDCRIWDFPQSGALYSVLEKDLPAYVQRIHSSLDEHLLSWSSVLDFYTQITEYGTCLDVIVFPGEKIPALPSCAKLMIRHWNPETDVPFSLENQ